jgi:peptidoglycan/LPS O-acetylase OafA/YrhL
MTTPDTDVQSQPARERARRVLIPSQTRGSTPAESTARLGFLDVLRGVAALSVVAFHLGNQGPVHTDWFGTFSHSVLNLGAFGVLVFFIVSGYIIPASLERTGSVRDFWVSRGFRLFPVFWLVSAAVVVLYYTKLLYLPGYVFKYKLLLLAGNVSLLSQFLGSSVLIGPGWTLPFEICFYLLTTVLFVTKLRGRSAGVALFGGVLSVVAWDRIFPMWAVTPRALGVKGHEGAPVRVILMALAIGAVAALLARSRAAALYAGVVGAGVTMLLLNRPWPLFQAATYITLMFTGTVIYRISARQITPRRGWSVVAVVAVLCCVAFFIHVYPLVTTTDGVRGESWETPVNRSVSLLAAAATFIVFYLLRDRVRWPGWLQWLGRISYSMYLIHWVVMNTVPPLPDGTPLQGPLTLVMWLAISLGLSTLTYHFVEAPAIALGRRVIRRLREGDRAKAAARAVAEAPATA